jgi:Asp/Glu/hydantoin racemase
MTQKRLLIINPNTTDAMTGKTVELARAMLPDVGIIATGGSFGPRYIASRASFAIAAHAALDAYAANRQGVDAVLLACFGDPGLDALREVSPTPVIGLVEAATAQASGGGRRFSIVTGGVLWQSMLRESLATRGLAEKLASIRTVAPDGGTIARDPEGALKLLAEACDACVAEDGAQAVILGGVGLIGLAGKIAAARSYPVICSVEAGIHAAGLALHSPRLFPEPARRPVDSIGLSPELAALMLEEPAPPPDSNSETSTSRP